MASLDCTKYGSGIDALQDEAFRNALGCAFGGQFGSVEIFIFMIMTAVYLALYIRTDSIVVPWTVFMTTGSVLLPMVAAPAVAVAMLVVAGVGAAAPLLLARRMQTP